MPHIHGLGYSADGRQLIVPAHDGLRIYADGAWQRAESPAHDYMGYAATNEGFYSSGHPASGSTLVNPLGLVKSSDGGRTLTTLGFSGQRDFHLMGVGYQNHAIYVLNLEPLANLPAGLVYSLDDGKTWQSSGEHSLALAPFQIAVHPTDPAILALATEAGLLLSHDHGTTFSPPAGSSGPVTAATFSPDGAKLFFGTTTLSAYDLAARHVKVLSIPALGSRDAISYIAVNPANAAEMTFATFARNIYRSDDGGQTWRQIAREGAVMMAP